MTINGHQNIYNESDEAQVVLRSLPRAHQADACVGTQRPVVVLTRSVHSFEWLFMQQDTETMLAADLTHQGHDEQVVVVCQVTFFKDRSQFELVGSYFVVAGLQWNTQFERFNFQLFHKFHDAGRNGTEVVIFQLLVLTAFVAHQRTTAKQQVGTGGIQTFVYQEVFLFPSQISVYFLYIRIEIVAYVDGGFIDGFQCFQQGSLIVQRFAGISNEDGRYTQGITNDKSRG